MHPLDSELQELIPEVQTQLREHDGQVWFDGWHLIRELGRRPTAGMLIRRGHYVFEVLGTRHRYGAPLIWVRPFRHWVDEKDWAGLLGD